LGVYPRRCRRSGSDDQRRPRPAPGTLERSFQHPERVVGFFNTYRQHYPVSRHTLRDIAEQFQRWLKGWSEKRNIPVAEAPKGRPV
jgi:hypothetical protein